MKKRRALLGAGCEQPASDGGNNGGGNPPSLPSPVLTYEVGSTGPAGGKIFYVNPNAVADGWTYLEAAPADLEGIFAWDTVRPAAIDVTTAIAIGSGKTNTDAISVALGDAGAAAKAAKAYAGGGKNDWFLPSKDKLNELYKARVMIGGFSDAWYWSSSQYDTSYAWYQYFASGSQYPFGYKSATYSVRVVRAF